MTKLVHKRRKGSKESADSEVNQLKRRIRIMARERQGYMVNAHITLKKQRREAALLTEEKRKRIEGEKKSFDMNRLKIDSRHIEQLHTLVASQRDYQRLLDVEVVECSDLDIKARIVAQKILDMKRKLGGGQKDDEIRISVDKSIRRLESTQQQLSKRLSSQFDTNAQLRSELKTLLIQKKIFTSLYERLTGQLNQLKQKIIQLYNTASSHYEGRLASIWKMKTLKDRCQSEGGICGSEMKILERMKMHDVKLKNFLDRKEDERVEYKQEEAQKIAKADLAGKALAEETQHVKKYEKLLKSILRLTGHNDMDVVVDEFNFNEEDKFSQYDYVSSLNQSVEELQSQIVVINQSIKQLKKEDKVIATNYKSQIASIQSSTVLTKEALAQQVAELAILNGTLEVIFKSVKKCNNALHCEKMPNENMLAYEDAVTADNVMSYIAHIEQTCLKFIFISQFIQQHEDYAGHLLVTARSLHRIKARERKQSTKYTTAPPEKPIPTVNVPSIGDDLPEPETADQATPGQKKIAAERDCPNIEPIDIQKLRTDALKKVQFKEAAGLLHMTFAASKKLKIKNK